jgi:IS30 family transposase
MLAKVDSKDTETVINALIKQAHKLPRELYKSLTRDRGKEMADHKRFSLATDIEVFLKISSIQKDHANDEQHDR